MTPLHLLDPNSQLDDDIPHPYQHEIEHIVYPSTMFQSSPPHEPESFDDTPFAWIDTQEGLNSLISDLAGVAELAIDLEHHDYRSFSGFLCLMQISTRSKDYIIDTLILREELEVLNLFFADPNIVKVCPY